MADMSRMKASRRLMHDLQELQNSPVPNISAAPLDDDMFEWHCNVEVAEVPYHLILSFPDKYPYEAPSAEMVPAGFRVNGISVRPGKKGGTELCLELFSNYLDLHSDWKNGGNIGVGWSTAYTVQAILLNLMAFLDEKNYEHNTQNNVALAKNFKCEACGHTVEKPFPPLGASDNEKTGVKQEDIDEKNTAGMEDEAAKKEEKEGVKKAEDNPQQEAVDAPVAGPSGDVPAVEAMKQSSVASEMEADAEAAVVSKEAHEIDINVSEEPAAVDDTTDIEMDEVSSVPPIALKKQQSALTPDMIDYISKKQIDVKKAENIDEIVGFGLIKDHIHGTGHTYSSPCEFILAESYYDMLKAVGKVESTTRQKVVGFLPLLTSSDNSTQVRSMLDDEMGNIIEQHADIVIPSSKDLAGCYILPLIMDSVIRRMAESNVVGEAQATSLFILHRLYLWAVNTYQGVAENMAEKMAEAQKSERPLCMRAVQNISGWLTQWSYTNENRETLARAFCDESWSRATINMVYSHVMLGKLDRKASHRVSQHFDYNKTTNKIIALQILFLNTAMPMDKTPEEVMQFYDSHSGFPARKSVQKFLDGTKKIMAMDSYADFFEVLGEKTPTDEDMNEVLVENLRYCLSTPGYHVDTKARRCPWMVVMKEFRAANKRPPRPRRAANKKAASASRGKSQPVRRSDRKRKNTDFYGNAVPSAKLRVMAV